MPTNTDGDMTDPVRPPRRLLWRVLLWGGGVLVGLIVLVLMLVGIESWRGHRAWAVCQRELSARGEKLDLKAFVPPPVPDDQNFAATPLFAGLEFKRWPGPEPMAWLKDFDRAESNVPSQRTVRGRRGPDSAMPGSDMLAWARAFRMVRTGDPEQPIPVTAPPGASAEVRAALEVLEALKVYEPALAELRQAAQRPASRFPIDYTQDEPAAIRLPHLAPLRKLCRVLQIRTLAEIVAGQGQAALEDVLLMLRVADAMKDEPLLVSQMVRLVCFQVATDVVNQGLAARVWTDPQLKQLQARFSQFDFVATAQQALRAERAFGVAMLEFLLRAPKRVGEEYIRLHESYGPERVGWLLFPPGWMRFEQANYCRAVQGMLLPDADIQRRRIDPRLVEEKQAKANPESIGLWKSLIQHCIFTRLLLPGLSKTYSRCAYAQTLADQAVLACALERYRLAQGQFPENLEVLVPAYLQQVPADVISGQPMRYRQTPDGGFALWSVGWNGTDDGGVPARKRQDLRSGDWVWKLPPQ
jgi:hypothetical protein